MIITLETDDKTDIKFCLDKPENDTVVGSGFYVSGWIIEKLGRVNQLTIYLSGTQVATFNEFYKRSDIQSMYPDYPNSIHSGFRKYVNNISEGQHELKIILTIDGKQYKLISKILNVIPPYDTNQVSQIMKNDWNKRAMEDAEKFVYNKRTLLTDEDYDRFSEEEPLLAIELLKTAFPEIQPSHMTMLEIGCGIGRLAEGFSKIVRNYKGVDVSEEMVKISKQRLANLQNVEFYTNNGIDLRMIKNNSEDFVFEAYVFQHIPQKDIVFNYCKESFRVLKDGGYFMALFWKNKLDREYAGIQDDLYTGESVPITNDTIYGIQFSESEIHDMLKEIGFIDIKLIPNTMGKGNRYHHLVVAKKPVKSNLLTRLLKSK